MLINLLAAAAVGVLVPLMLRRMKIDPALSAGVILTTFTDCIGFATLLGLGTIFPHLRKHGMLKSYGRRLRPRRGLPFRNVLDKSATSGAS